MRHELCFLTLRKWPKLSRQRLQDTFLHPLLGAQTQWLFAEQDQLPCGSTGISSSSCEETETRMVRPGHDPRQHLQNIFQGTLEGRRRPGWQRKFGVDNAKEWLTLPMPELFTTASCRKDWKRISAESSLVSSTTQSVKGLNWTECCRQWSFDPIP